MRMSGTAPSTLILSQTKYSRTLTYDAPKMPKHIEAETAK